MKQFTTIEEVDNFICNYNWYESRSRNQHDEYEILKSCEKIAQQENNSKLLCKTRAYLTSYYSQNNNLQAALDVGISNFKVAKQEKFHDELLLMFSFLIPTYQLLGDYAQAEEYLLECKEYVLNLDDNKRKCSTYIVSAIQYYYTKNYEKSYEDYETALIYALILNDPYTLANLYNNYGLHLIEKNIPLAEEKLFEGQRIILNALKNHKKIGNLLGYNYCNLAELYIKTKQHEDCIKNAKRAITIFKKNNNQTELLEAKLLLANGFLNINKLNSTKKLLLEIESESIESSAKSILLKCYKLTHLLFSKKRKHSLAYDFLLKYQELLEEIFNEESNQKIRNLQISHEVKTIKLERENAENLARLKHDFLANMSHEIRTPINSIIGIAYLLEQDNLNDKQLSYVRRLTSNSQILLSIINDILDISKIEAGKFDLVLEPFSIIDALQDVYQQFDLKAKEKGIDFSLENTSGLDKNTLLMGDSNRLKQILINLTSNAIKFTENGSVRIILDKIENQISISVADTGIGIPKDRINLLFDRYEQISPETKLMFGGTGLGLAISKKLCELMNGKIELKSEYEKGTEFIIRLPFNPINNSHDPQPKVIKDYINTGKLKHLSCLIVDDNSENRTTIEDLLLSFNKHIRIYQAENGQKAIDFLKTNKATLILMDLDMPVKNGIEATAEIRKIYNSKQIKIIGTTAGLFTNTMEEFIALGFNDIISKPCAPELFIQKIIHQL